MLAGARSDPRRGEVATLPRAVTLAGARNDPRRGKVISAEGHPARTRAGNASHRDKINWTADGEPPAESDQARIQTGPPSSATATRKQKATAYASTPSAQEDVRSSTTTTTTVARASPRSTGRSPGCIRRTPSGFGFPRWFRRCQRTRSAAGRRLRPGQQLDHRWSMSPAHFLSTRARTVIAQQPPPARGSLFTRRQPGVGHVTPVRNPAATAVRSRGRAPWHRAGRARRSSRSSPGG